MWHLVQAVRSSCLDRGRKKYDNSDAAAVRLHRREATDRRHRGRADSVPQGQRALLEDHASPWAVAAVFREFVDQKALPMVARVSCGTPMLLGKGARHVAPGTTAMWN